MHVVRTLLTHYLFSFFQLCLFLASQFNINTEIKFQSVTLHFYAASESKKWHVNFMLLYINHDFADTLQVISFKMASQFNINTEIKFQSVTLHFYAASESKKWHVNFMLLYINHDFADTLQVISFKMTSTSCSGKARVKVPSFKKKSQFFYDIKYSTEFFQLNF